MSDGNMSAEEALVGCEAVRSMLYENGKTCFIAPVGLYVH